MRSVCLNPTIELTYGLDSFTGPVESSHFFAKQFGGKGVNVARVARRLGAQSSLTMLSAADAEAQNFAEMLKNENVAMDALPALDRSRYSIVLEAPDGRSLIIRDPGGEVDANWDDLLNSVVGTFESGEWVALSGSLPRNVPDHAYHDICVAANSIGVLCAVDCAGPALQLALQAPLNVVKVNIHEARVALDVGPAASESHELARELMTLGAEVAVVTDGPRGASVACEAGVYRLHVKSLPDTQGTGAGDAFLAGLLVAKAQGLPWPEAAALGAQAGAAATLVGGSGVLPASLPTLNSVVLNIEELPQ